VRRARFRVESLVSSFGDRLSVVRGQLSQESDEQQVTSDEQGFFPRHS
jgi:hypothetical protein